MSQFNPEAEARENIDRLLTAAGWHVVDCDQVNSHVARGVAFNELSRKQGYGEAYYLLLYSAGPQALAGPARKPNAGDK